MEEKHDNDVLITIVHEKLYHSVPTATGRRQHLHGARQTAYPWITALVCQ
jgi:hypothetical protein